MLIIIPLIFLINLTVKGESISLGDIHKIANNFASLTSATSDWLADIKKITNNSKHFIKICGPAGALVALGFDIAFPSDSPEQKAITQLHKDVMEKFKALDVTLQSMEGNILHKLNLVPYKSDVTSKLLDLKALYLQAINPSLPTRQNAKSEFIRECTTLGPVRVLVGIAQHTVDQCPTPKPRSENLYVSYLQIFFDIENRFRGKFDEHLDGYSDYQSMKFDILYKQFFFKYTIVSSELNVLKNKVKQQLESKIIIDDLKVFLSLMRNISFLHYQIDDCILLSAFVANEDRTESAQLIVSMINHDIMKSLHYASICANSAYGGDKDAIDSCLDSIWQQARSILTFCEQWITIKLLNQWPSTQIKYAINTIKEDKVEASRYNITAKNIGNALIKRGLPGYHYHVLVTPNWLGDQWIYGPYCSADNCNLTTTNSTNIVIFRHKIDSIELAVSAKRWYNETNPTIREYLSLNANNPSMNVIVAYVNAQIGSLITKEGYHGFFLIRNMKFFGVSCVIDFGIYVQPALTELPYSLIDVYEPYFGDNALIYLFLFI